MSDWRELAACRGEDPRLFFPIGEGRATYVEARRICGRCPVRAACLDETLAVEGTYAVRSGKASNLRHGMFGGATPRERADMHWLYRLKVGA